MINTITKFCSSRRLFKNSSDPLTDSFLLCLCTWVFGMHQVLQTMQILPTQR